MQVFSFNCHEWQVILRWASSLLLWHWSYSTCSYTYTLKWMKILFLSCSTQWRPNVMRSAPFGSYSKIVSSFTGDIVFSVEGFTIGTWPSACAKRWELLNKCSSWLGIAYSPRLARGETTWSAEEIEDCVWQTLEVSGTSQSVRTWSLLCDVCFDWSRSCGC